MNMTGQHIGLIHKCFKITIEEGDVLGQNPHVLTIHPYPADYMGSYTIISAKVIDTKEFLFAMRS